MKPFINTLPFTRPESQLSQSRAAPSILDFTEGLKLQLHERRLTPFSNQNSQLSMGVKTSAFKVMNSSACMSSGLTSAMKSASRAKRKSSALIAHRKPKTNPLIRASLAPPEELMITKIKETWLQRPITAKAKARADLLFSRPVMPVSALPSDPTPSAISRVSRVKADELLRGLLLARHSRHRSMQEALDLKLQRGVTPVSKLHKQVQYDENYC